MWKVHFSNTVNSNHPRKAEQCYLEKVYHIHDLIFAKDANILFVQIHILPTPGFSPFSPFVKWSPFHHH